MTSIEAPWGDICRCGHDRSAHKYGPCGRIDCQCAWFNGDICGNHDSGGTPPPPHPDNSKFNMEFLADESH